MLLQSLNDNAKMVRSTAASVRSLRPDLLFLFLSLCLPSTFSFLFLVPSLGSLGTALAVLLAFVSSAIPCVIWSDKTILKYIFFTTAAFLLGWLTVYVSDSIIEMNPFLKIVFSILFTFLVLVALKNIRSSELIEVGKIFQKRITRNRTD